VVGGPATSSRLAPGAAYDCRVGGDWRGAQQAGAQLLIVGSGGFGRESAQAARDGGFDGEVLGFLDDNPALAGASIAGLPVIGPIDAVHRFPDASIIVATGRPDQYTSRHTIVARLGLPRERYATIVHPRAMLAGDTEVGPGSVVLAGAVATAGVRIGAHVAVMPSVVLTHETSVRDFATLASAVALAGGVTIGTAAYLGAGTMVRQDLRVGALAMTGMGSLVLSEVPPRRLWYGRPAADRGPSPAAGYQGIEE
jgi:sugar O-acyltransferase (sialic acid O-acetyltransferase NeuD family)